MLKIAEIPVMDLWIDDFGFTMGGRGDEIALIRFEEFGGDCRVSVTYQNGDYDNIIEMRAGFLLVARERLCSE